MSWLWFAITLLALAFAYIYWNLLDMARAIRILAVEIRKLKARE
jgi:hypothetical protein